jgi:hypothetical protein
MFSSFLKWTPVQSALYRITLSATKVERRNTYTRRMCFCNLAGHAFTERNMNTVDKTYVLNVWWEREMAGWSTDRSEQIICFQIATVQWRAPHAKRSCLQMNNINLVQNATNERNSEIYSTNIICYDNILESLTNSFRLLINKKFVLEFF